jgi:hypothetical protein
MIKLKSILSETASPKAIEWAKKFKADLGLTDEAAAAMAANIQHESGFMADRIQGAGVKTGTLADSGGLGYSWAQWTYGARKKNFRKHVLDKFKVDIKKKPATDKFAYDFLKHEIIQYPGFNFNKFKQSTNLEQATTEFVSKYEQAGKPMLNTRIALAKDILNAIKPKQSKQKTTLPGAEYMTIGKTLYPRNTSKHNYANVRTEPTVNNGFINNIIATIEWPNPVGVAKKSKTDDRMMTWYYVKLPKNISLLHDYGWVRFDAVTIDKNSKYI